MMSAARLIGAVGLAVLVRSAEVAVPASYAEERAWLVAVGEGRRFDAEARASLTPADVVVGAALDGLASEVARNGSLLAAQPVRSAQAALEASALFRALRTLPKGAVLHLHWDSALPAAWLVRNATYRPSLWWRPAPDGGVAALKFSRAAPAERWRRLDATRGALTAREVAAFDRRLVARLETATYEAYSPVGADRFPKFQTYFDVAEPLMMYGPVFSDYFAEIWRTAADDWRVSHVELRALGTTVYDLDTADYGARRSAVLVNDTLNAFNSARNARDPLTAALIYYAYKPAAPPSLDPASPLWTCVGEAAALHREFPDFVVGFDLVGEEDASAPLREYAAPLRAAFEAHATAMPLYLHAGETKETGAGTAADDVLDAAALYSRRIGHGLSLAHRPSVVDALRARTDFALEICPISNQALGYVDDLRTHPASHLLEAGLAITLSPDDPTPLGYGDIALDWTLAYLAWNLDVASLKQLARNSLRHAALPEPLKLAKLAAWEADWTAYAEAGL